MREIAGRVDAALDAALEMTFPASDPIAVFTHEQDTWELETTHVVRSAQTRIALDDAEALVPL